MPLLGLRRNVHGALDRSRVACDLERVEVLLELNGPAVADRPDVGDLCFAFLSLPVKSEVIVAESHTLSPPLHSKISSASKTSLSKPAVKRSKMPERTSAIP